ncbi:MAG: hypothetical protein PUB39_06275 [Eubacteriales bacterium]|nr:hypothetical protein [Eubacteriales bacterium]
MVNMQIKNFYKDAEELFHEYAKAMDFAAKGVLEVPDLNPKRELFVLTVLQDNQIKARCGGDPNVYYYNICRFCLTAGMEYAVQWHVKPEGFKEEGYDKILYDNVVQRTSGDIVDKVCHSSEQWKKFQMGLFGVWCRLMDKEMQKEDTDDRIINSFFAVFQLGESIALDKWGY